MSKERKNRKAQRHSSSQNRGNYVALACGRPWILRHMAYDLNDDPPCMYTWIHVCWRLLVSITLIRAMGILTMNPQPEARLDTTGILTETTGCKRPMETALISKKNRGDNISSTNVWMSDVFLDTKYQCWTAWYSALVANSLLSVFVVAISLTKRPPLKQSKHTI